MMTTVHTDRRTKTDMVRASRTPVVTSRRAVMARANHATMVLVTPIPTAVGPYPPVATVMAVLRVLRRITVPGPPIRMATPSCPAAMQARDAIMVPVSTTPTAVAPNPLVATVIAAPGALRTSMGPGLQIHTAAPSRPAAMVQASDAIMVPVMTIPMAVAPNPLLATIMVALAALRTSMITESPLHTAAPSCPAAAMAQANDPTMVPVMITPTANPLVAMVTAALADLGTSMVLETTIHTAVPSRLAMTTTPDLAVTLPVVNKITSTRVLAS